MTEETIILILLVVVMLVGSYLAGSIPLVMKLSEVCIVRTHKPKYLVLRHLIPSRKNLNS